MRNFLFSVVMTAAFIGIPTLAHWLWTGRSRPLAVSYHGVLLYIVRWFGTVYAAFDVLFLLIASLDLLRGSGLGYPAWSLPVITMTVAVGLIIRWVAGLWLAGPDD